MRSTRISKAGINLFWSWMSVNSDMVSKFAVSCVMTNRGMFTWGIFVNIVVRLVAPCVCVFKTLWWLWAFHNVRSEFSCPTTYHMDITLDYAHWGYHRELCWGFIHSCCVVHIGMEISFHKYLIPEHSSTIWISFSTGDWMRVIKSNLSKFPIIVKNRKRDKKRSPLT